MLSVVECIHVKFGFLFFDNSSDLYKPTMSDVKCTKVHGLLCVKSWTLFNGIACKTGGLKQCHLISFNILLISVSVIFKLR